MKQKILKMKTKIWPNNKNNLDSQLLPTNITCEKE